MFVLCYCSESRIHPQDFRLVRSKLAALCPVPDGRYSDCYREWLTKERCRHWDEGKALATLLVRSARRPSEATDTRWWWSISQARTITLQAIHAGGSMR